MGKIRLWLPGVFLLALVAALSLWLKRWEAAWPGSEPSESIPSVSGSRRESWGRWAGPTATGEPPSQLPQSADSKGSPDQENGCGSAGPYLDGRGSTSSAVRVREAAAANDRGVVYLRSTGQMPSNFGRALSCFDLALELAPTLLPARYNRALTLGALSLRNQALHGWSSYLVQDGASRWSAEARGHVAALYQPSDGAQWRADLPRLAFASRNRDTSAIRLMVGKNTELARLHAQDELLPRWGALYLRGDTASRRQAAESLQVFRDIALALREITGDGLLQQISQILEAESRDVRRLSAIAAGLGEYRRGEELYAGGLYSQAEERHEAARVALERLAFPLSHWAAFRRAHCLYQRSAYAEALAALSPLSRDPELPVLAATSERLAGTIHLLESRPEEALHHYRSALARFERCRERGNAVSTHTRLADAYESLGQGEVAWRHRILALRDVERLEDNQRIRATLLEAAGALRTSSPRAALSLANEAVAILSRSIAPGDAIAAFRTRAELHERLGRPERALADLRRAEEAALRLEEPALIETHRAEIFAAKSGILASVDPREALRAFDQAIRSCLSTRYVVLLADLYHLRGSTEEKLGLLDRAEASYRLSVAQRERERSRVRSVSLRTSIFDLSSDVHSALVRFLVEKRDRPEQELEVLERARGRVILEGTQGLALDSLASAADGAPMSLRLFRERLPRDVAVLEYEVQDAVTYLWVVRRSKTTFLRLPVSRSDLQRHAVGLDRSMRALPRRAIDRAAAMALFRALVEPALSSIPEGSTLAIVPSGLLWSLPFSALVDPRTGRYLAETHSTLLAPSLGVLLSRKRRREAISATAGETLLIAATEPDGRLPGPFQRLSFASGEVDLLARLHPDALRLEGKAATKGRLLARLPVSTLVHFAGHARLNEPNPLLSALVLARDPEDPGLGLLHVYEILRLDLRRIELVMLAACNTGVGEQSLEGVRSLALPFLQRGARQVLVTRSGVLDSEASRFSVRFHASLARGRSAVEALREAKMFLLKSREPGVAAPASWAGFDIVGAL